MLLSKKHYCFCQTLEKVELTVSSCWHLQSCRSLQAAAGVSYLPGLPPPVQSMPRLDAGGQCWKKQSKNQTVGSQETGEKEFVSIIIPSSCPVRAQVSILGSGGRPCMSLLSDMNACESLAPWGALGELDTKLLCVCLGGIKGTCVCQLVRQGMQAPILRVTLLGT